LYIENAFFLDRKQGNQEKGKKISIGKKVGFRWRPLPIPASISGFNQEVIKLIIYFDFIQKFYAELHNFLLCCFLYFVPKNKINFNFSLTPVPKKIYKIK
jgi:hypothetical protein